ncbi:phosphatidylinositol-specific phospholipase C/glycerophosphodiester phosphodiesterase family protein [Paenibacillus hodogayensis]|uniref:Phosphatidylinositol-specific phospholipase C/glycerophosphodiester phosphodiesterase family protein n=1 Tax=Paenibacillus hodogayensis TaxID=279208 RepID=A0ABV5W6Y8_9BACL
MIKKTVCWSLIAVLIIWCGWGLIWSGKEREIAVGPIDGWKANTLIAHALGGIQGFKYTNSYDAFIANYHRGFRLFEVDLLQTEEGELVARHDWSQNLQPDLTKNSLIQGRFRPLAWPDILQLMQIYPDFYLIIDMKASGNENIHRQFEHLVNETLRADPSLLNRMIPELFSPAMYDTVMSIYPFPNNMYSLYNTAASATSILQFVKEKHISAVAMPVYRVFMNPNLVRSLQDLGVRSYVHTVNGRWTMDLLSSFGVYGFYTDREVSPVELALAHANVSPDNGGFPEYSSADLVKISTFPMKVKNNG